MTDYLTVDDLITIAERIGVSQIRDLGLLDSAAKRPAIVVWGCEVYPSIDVKAAVLMESLVNNHSLVDGNKRLGWVATKVFLRINGFDLNPPSEDAAYDLVLGIASSTIDYHQVARVLNGWITAQTPG
jgi:death-on-curing protein